MYTRKLRMFSILALMSILVGLLGACAAVGPAPAAAPAGEATAEATAAAAEEATTEAAAAPAAATSDNPYLDSRSNGLTFVAERFKSQDVAGHVLFTKSERSKLASIAVEIL